MEWKLAEQLAYEHLVGEGYTVRERNWKLRRLEIDMIAQLGDTIIFVEVKSRSGRHRDPLDAIDDRKIRNMVRAANAYLLPLEHTFSWRFDVILLVGPPHDYRLEHIPDAFLPPLS